MRVLVLMHKDLIPPDSLEGYTDKEIVEWKAEYDVVTTLREMGHEAKPLGVEDDLGVIRKALRDWKPHIVFNLLEEFHGVALYDQHVISFLELMRQSYTGCNPRGLVLAHDKALTKKILSYHRIRVPGFTTYPRGKPIKPPRHLRYPLFVKSLIEEGSYGISQASIVTNDEKFVKRVEYLHEQLETHAIAEEYIEGREMYLAIMGNKRLSVLPIIELVFNNMPEGSPRIATSKVKWDWEYQKKHGIDTVVPEDLSLEMSSRIGRLGKRIYRALYLSGYARIDFRITPDNEIYVLEANPNPDPGFGEELSDAAEAAGMSYEQLLKRIINLGLRYPAEWRLV